ncbi:MAG: hypothetical protein ACRD36_02425, partial [Candidatus Acidiferrum sp.]
LWANVVLPLGWLPLGAMSLAGGNYLAALLCTVGLASIGSVCMWRSYRTTVRLYTGEFTGGGGRPVEVKKPVPTEVQPSRFLERRLPWVTEETSAIAFASFRGLTRAPEAKMMLLPAIFMLVMFGVLLFSRSASIPPAFRSLLPYGAIGLSMLSTVQLLGNQFGFDRDGFRVFVLSAAPRRHILLGKNLAFAPFAIMICLTATMIAAVLFPMRIDYLLAVIPQFVSIFLVYCLGANLLSIFAPLPIAAGSLRPKNPKFIPILLHLLFMMCLAMLLTFALWPLAVSLLFDRISWAIGALAYLSLAVLQCVAVVFLYRAILAWQGTLLQRREKKILDVVTTKAE